MSRNDKLHDLIKQRLDTQDTIKGEQDRLTEINQQILDTMEEKGQDRYEDLGGSATVVRPGKKKSYDWAKLQKLVGRLVFKKIVVEVPSEDLLDQAIARGEITPEQLGQCITEREGSKPYVRVARSKG